jgi:hypothetical protein
VTGYPPDESDVVDPDVEGLIHILHPELNPEQLRAIDPLRAGDAQPESDATATITAASHAAPFTECRRPVSTGA